MEDSINSINEFHIFQNEKVHYNRYRASKNDVSLFAKSIKPDHRDPMKLYNPTPMIKRPSSDPLTLASQSQRRLLKALRHGFAIAMEAQRKASLSLGGGVIQFPGVPVI